MIGMTTVFLETWWIAKLDVRGHHFQVIRQVNSILGLETV